MRSSRTRVVAAAALVPLALLTACGNDDDNSSSSGSGASGASASKASGASGASGSSSSSTATPSTVPASQVSSINNVKVKNADSSKPSVSLSKKPFHVNKTTTKVIKQGKGDTVGSKDIAYTDYVAMHGTTGKTMDSTFGKTPAAFALGSQQTFPGLAKALKGKKVGTEMVVAVPPSEGFGGKGNSQLKVTNKDTLVFYVKVTDSAPILKTAKGKKVTPPSDAPKVSLSDTPYAQAKITMPKGYKAPTKLKTNTLIQGDGPTVKAGQTILASYTGVLASNGKVFDASAKQKQPASFQIGSGQVIKAWDQALVGKKAGSRVLIQAPASLAYGKQAKKDQSGKTVIPKNSPLVFVVDILAVG